MTPHDRALREYYDEEARRAETARPHPDSEWEYQFAILRSGIPSALTTGR